jgi:hypothetical protein
MSCASRPGGRRLSERSLLTGFRLPPGDTGLSARYGSGRRQITPTNNHYSHFADKSAEQMFCRLIFLRRGCSLVKALAETEDWPCERSVPAAAVEASARRCEHTGQ